MEASDTDESISWRSAGIIMALAAIITLTTSILGIDRFPLIFDIFIVYLPAAVLLGSILFRRFRQPTAQHLSLRPDAWARRVG